MEHTRQILHAYAQNGEMLMLLPLPIYLGLIWWLYEYRHQNILGTPRLFYLVHLQLIGALIPTIAGANALAMKWSLEAGEPEWALEAYAIWAIICVIGMTLNWFHIYRKYCEPQIGDQYVFPFMKERC